MEAVPHTTVVVEMNGQLASKNVYYLKLFWLAYIQRKKDELKKM